MYSEGQVQAGATPVGETGEHRVRIEERGSFAFADCTCGWLAPGRRSRDRARRDADEHLNGGQA